MSVLHLADISFRYPNAKTDAIKSATCSLEAGKITAVTGASASGKTTLGKILKGFLEPQSGEIGIIRNSGEFEKAPPKQRLKQIGWSCAHPEVQIFAATVEEEVGFAPRNQGLNGSRLAERIDWALKLTGLKPEEALLKNPLALSGGEKRRVALASVIAMDCDWYVFDEPTAGLDYNGCLAVIMMAENLAGQGKGVCWITHDLDLIEDVANDILQMEEGRIVIL